MGIKLDSVISSTLHEAYQNYKKQTVTIDISGTVPNGGAVYSDTVTLDRDRTRADVYHTASLDGNYRLTNQADALAGFAVPAVSTQQPLTVLEYSGNELEVGVYITNTSGAPEPLVTQTLTFYVVEYHAPISAL